MAWQCEALTAAKNHLVDKFYAPKTKDVNVEHYTVGQKIDFQCRGEAIDDFALWQVSMSRDVIKAKLPVFRVVKEDWLDASTLNLSLRVFQVSKEPYQFVLKKGDDKVSLEGASVLVSSILQDHELSEKKEGPSGQITQQPKAYPMPGAVKMSYPPAFWLYSSLLVFFLLAYALRKGLQYRKLKKIRLDLAEEARRRKPLQDFYKNLREVYRQKEKDYDYLGKLKSSYYDYIKYKFLVPTENWTSKDIYRFIKKQNANIPNHTLNELLQNLKELQALKERRVEKEELSQLLEDLQINVEDLDKNARGKNR
tara:strand:+ start:7886 stop:8815 length:930 start_codon:yes stop_codon:yes gene_type:complete